MHEILKLAYIYRVIKKKPTGENKKTLRALIEDKSDFINSMTVTFTVNFTNQNLVSNS